MQIHQSIFHLTVQLEMCECCSLNSELKGSTCMRTAMLGSYLMIPFIHLNKKLILENFFFYFLLWH